MSKNRRNYNQDYKSKNEEVKPQVETVEEEIMNEPVEAEVTEETDLKTPQTPVVEKPQVTAKPNKLGVVANCERLNVRKQPNINAPKVCVLDEGDEVVIADDHDPEFYSIKVKSFTGFCMKRFIEVK